MLKGFVVKGGMSVLFAALLLLGACAKAGDGDLVVSYEVRGQDTPEYVNVYVVDRERTGLNCQSIRDARRFTADEVTRNLPTSGEAEFPRLRSNARYLVYAVAFADGLEVAHDCEIDVRIPDGGIGELNLFLEAEPLRLTGRYEGELDLELADSGSTTNTVFTVGAGLCGLLNTGSSTSDLCRIVQSVALTLADLRIRVRWELNSSDTGVSGRMEWITVNGVEVGPGWDLIDGSFSGNITGRNKVAIRNFNTRVRADDLIRFVLEEVSRITLPGGVTTELVLQQLVGSLTFREADLELLDNDRDGVADSFTGRMLGDSDFFLVGSGEVEVDHFSAFRVLGPGVGSLRN